MILSARTNFEMPNARILERISNHNFVFFTVFEIYLIKFKIIWNITF